MVTNRISSSSLQPWDWQAAFESIFLETDRNAVFRALQQLEPVLLLRRDALLVHARDHAPEWNAVDDALGRLRILKEDLLRPSV
jgi:hypothetical protein